MRINRERLAMGILFAGLPCLLYGLVIRPSSRRLEALRQRIQAANEEPRDFEPFTPVSPGERAFLESTDPPWRTRLPLISDDAALMAHVDRVVTEVESAMRARGVRITAIKSAWERLPAYFTVPGPFSPAPRPPEIRADLPEYLVRDWVLEVGIDGTPGELFKALSAIHHVNPLLEPAGLRWEAASGGERDHPRARQWLLLRNLFLAPGGAP